jgi:hypothetical protein
MQKGLPVGIAFDRWRSLDQSANAASRESASIQSGFAWYKAPGLAMQKVTSLLEKLAIAFPGYGIMKYPGNSPRNSVCGAWVLAPEFWSGAAIVVQRQPKGGFYHRDVGEEFIDPFAGEGSDAKMGEGARR